MGDANNLDAAVEGFEQNYPIPGSLSWGDRKGDFIELFGAGRFEDALRLARELNIARPLVCHAVYDTFIFWLRANDKTKYLRAIEVFRDYGFEHWISQKEVF